MENKNLNLEKVKIDSLKLRVPRHHCKIISPTFAQEYQKIVCNTGEIDPEVSLDKHKIHLQNGITTRIAVFNQIAGNMIEEQIIFQINAKQLGHNYFEGITDKNIKELYNYVMALNIVYCSYISFLDGYVSDIDFCIDLEVEPKAMQQGNTYLYNHIKPSLYKYVSKPFCRKENTGMQFNNRAKATPSKPFVKIYHKGIELEFKSTEFAQVYLSGYNFKKVGRIEYTLKNAKHKEKLKLKFKTMKELLEMLRDNQIENKINVFDGVHAYIDKPAIQRNVAELSPTDRLILYFIDKFVENGADKEAIFSALQIFDWKEEAQQKSRMKKKLLRIVKEVSDVKKMEENKDGMTFLRMLKFDF